METIKIGLIGVLGFARTHLRNIREAEKRGLCELSAVVILDPESESNKMQVDELQRDGVTVYPEFEQLIASEQGNCQLIVIPCGINEHSRMSIAALQAGYHVLCEKPVAGSVKDARAMQKAQQISGKMLAIGYQRNYSPAVQEIKRIKISNSLGKLVKAKMYVLWPRFTSYYNRNAWAGKLLFNGKTIFDSPLQNANAHFINEMLYIAGNLPHTSATPLSVYAENYRAEIIESADTQFIRMYTESGVEILAYASHAVEKSLGPNIEYQFERGSIRIDADECTRIYNQAGECIQKIRCGEYDEIRMTMYDNIFRSIQSGNDPLATVSNALQQVICIENSFASSQVSQIDLQYLGKVYKDIDPENSKPVDENDYNTYIKGLDSEIEKLFDSEKSFSEAGFPWGKQGKTIIVGKIK